MNKKILLATVSCLMALPLMLLSAQAKEDRHVRTVLNVQLAELAQHDPVTTVSSREYRDVEIPVEFIDPTDQTQHRAEFSRLGGAQSPSFNLSAVAPDQSAFIRRAADCDVGLTATYESGG